MNNNLMMLMKMLQCGKNPDVLVQNMIKSNPQLNGIVQQAQKSGDVKKFVMQYAKQRNIDIGPLMDMVNNRGIKM